MKSLSLITALLISTVSIQAKPMSNCHHSCFEQKYKCNIDKAYLLNNCDGALADCKVSCDSKDGKKQYASTSISPLEISF
ncbi:MAG: hypothetical protein H0X26_03235 [Alphaproteobacteria bacterium]|nr:hypothetical protein [Alphaproteobacteria bacterium]